VDPQTTWIDPDVELEADSTIHPSRSCAAARAWRPAPRWARTWSPHDAEIGPDAKVGPFCYLRPGNEAGSRRQGGDVRRDQERRDRRPDEGAAPLLHRRCRGREDSNIAAGNITANYPHQPRPAQGEDEDRAERPHRHSQWVRGAGGGRDDAWIAGGSYITEDVPPESLAGFPPKQITKEGYLRESTTTELTRLPGLEVAETKPELKA